MEKTKLILPSRPGEWMLERLTEMSSGNSVWDSIGSIDDSVDLRYAKWVVDHGFHSAFGPGSYRIANRLGNDQTLRSVIYGPRIEADVDSL